MEAKTGQEMIPILASSLCLNLVHSKIGNHFSSKLASFAFLNEDHILPNLKFTASVIFELQKHR
jgi:hypothetical protein